MSPTSRACFPVALALFLAGVANLYPLPGRSEGEPAKPPKNLTNSVGMTMLRVPGGKFIMGSPETEKGRNPDEVPHEVEITRPFYLGAFEVTQEQFEKVMGYNPSFFCPEGKGKDGVEYLRHPGGGARYVRGQETASFPVENISWAEAVEFCQKLSARKTEKAAGRDYRLPTEAEWEYACREAGAKKGPFHFGESLTSRFANFNGLSPYGTEVKGVSLGHTCKVGSYKANALGLHDLHGNVCEWCSDWYAEDYYSKSPRKDPTGPGAGVWRVVRGGFCAAPGSDCRSAMRNYSEPTDHSATIGIRVVVGP